MFFVAFAFWSFILSRSLTASKLSTRLLFFLLAKGLAQQREEEEGVDDFLKGELILGNGDFMLIVFSC